MALLVRVYPSRHPCRRRPPGQADEVALTSSLAAGLGTGGAFASATSHPHDAADLEPPTALEANRLADEKLKVLEAVVPPHVEEVLQMAVRAQYGGAYSVARRCRAVATPPKAIDRRGVRATKLSRRWSLERHRPDLRTHTDQT